MRLIRNFAVICFPSRCLDTDAAFKFSFGQVDHPTAGIASKQIEFPVSVNANKVRLKPLSSPKDRADLVPDDWKASRMATGTN